MTCKGKHIADTQQIWLRLMNSPKTVNLNNWILFLHQGAADGDGIDWGGEGDNIEIEVVEDSIQLNTSQGMLLWYLLQKSALN